ncbi:hypothetical protein [Frankia sp. CiP1_Cm_nod2]|uniref:hypothetical protein n=1 Tax=Frankia sp. CiP1_Cm_nod2 TaxID=2897161 RepID=UPI002025A289
MALDKVYVGAHGTLGIAVEGTPAQQADFTAVNDAYSSAVVGRVTDVEVCVRTELEEFYEIGARDVSTISPGNVHISGGIGRAYINGSLLFLLLGRGALEKDRTSIQPRFVLNLTLRNSHIPDNALKVNVFGVKFETWGFRLPQEGFVMEQVRFKATRIGVLDNEAGKDVSVTFPALPAS